MNSLATHESKKVSLLEAYKAIHHYDIDVFQKHHDSSISNDEKDISIKGYTLVKGRPPK